jgi:hypothetical protein
VKKKISYNLWISTHRLLGQQQQLKKKKG